LAFDFSTEDKDTCPPGIYTVTIETCLGEKCVETGPVDIPIDDPCLTTDLTLGPSPFPPYTEQLLDANAIPLAWTVNGLLFKDTSVDCGPIIVEITDLDGNPIDPVVFDDIRNPD